MNILINGTNGFVGGYLRKYFSNHNVTALSSAELDFSDSALVASFFDSHNKFDVVINCAARGRYQATAQDHDILATNIKIFMNLDANRKYFGKLINIGSGAEFGLTNNIHLARESDIFNVLPSESYGLSKNIITRLITQNHNYFNVRLFGCFDSTEPEKRLLSGFRTQYKNQGVFNLSNDRYSDFVSAYDLSVVIENIIDDQITDPDLNVVYKQKYLLSEILTLYCNLHNIPPTAVVINSASDKNYTGDSALVDRYNLPFKGLAASLKEYYL